MNKKDEALKMAIKVLSEDEGWMEDVEEALQACKEALDTEQVREDLPTQEPVAFRNKNTGEFCTGGFLLNHGWDKEWIKLYTHPKEWQGLSDEEILEIPVGSRLSTAKAIEQKLKEKNT